MYDVDKCSTVLETVTGFARLLYGPVTKCGIRVFYTLGKQTSHSSKCCTIRNAIGVKFLEVQIPLHVAMIDWDP